MKKILLAVILFTFLVISISGCSAADIASNNISKAADNFEITRRIVFYNSITGEWILTVTGLCSLGNYDVDRELSVTCKLGENKYFKHFLGLSDNVTYISEQLEPFDADIFHYRVIYSPTTIVPNLELRSP